MNMNKFIFRSPTPLPTPSPILNFSPLWILKSLLCSEVNLKSFPHRTMGGGEKGKILLRWKFSENFRWKFSLALRKVIISSSCVLCSRIALELNGRDEWLILTVHTELSFLLIVITALHQIHARTFAVNPYKDTSNDWKLKSHKQRLKCILKRINDGDGRTLRWGEPGC